MSEFPAREVVRPTEESVRARLAETGISLSEELAPGTVANLIVLQDHMLTVRGFVLDDYRRVAMNFEP